MPLGPAGTTGRGGWDVGDTLPPGSVAPLPVVQEPPPFNNEYRRSILNRYQRLGQIAGPVAAAMVVPAAAMIPAAIAALNAGDTYGDAGSAVAGGSALAGGIAGSLVGRDAGRYLSGGRRFGARTTGGAIGALLGAGMGAGAGGLVNTAAKAAVDRADTGEPGMMADIGRALDDLGYRSNADLENAALNKMVSSPAYQAIQRQKMLAETEQRSRMAEQLYLQALAQGAMGNF